MSRGGNARRSRFSWTLRAAACLVLAVIAADVAADSACDGASIGVAYVTTGGPGASGTNEPCSDFCVPDCFCCSRSVTAGQAVPPPDLLRLAPIAAPAAERWPEGVRPAVDHPPLARV